MTDDNHANALRPITIQGLSAAADRAEQKLAEVRAMMLAPTRRKNPPSFTPTTLAALCEISKDQFNRRLAKGELPKGTMQGARRHFTLAEAQQWVRVCQPTWQRPSGARGQVITFAQSKGGVGKTTGAVGLGQYLTLRGLRVLMVDADPQGSTTTLLHSNPAAVSGDDTLLPLFLADKDGLVEDASNNRVRFSLRDSITTSYWENLDVIPAMPGLFAAEFALPSAQIRDKEGRFAFWDVLRVGLEELRTDYDAIIIDTAPSVSYININAVFASDGLIVPTPTSMLDYSSSSQFWRLFADIADSIKHRKNIEKVFQFIHVVLTKVPPKNPAADIVRGWIYDSYPDFVLPVEIPRTQAVDNSSTVFETIYDEAEHMGNRKTYERARESYDRVNEKIALSIQACWAREVAAPTRVEAAA